MFSKIKIKNIWNNRKINHIFLIFIEQQAVQGSGLVQRFDLKLKKEPTIKMSDNSTDTLYGKFLIFVFIFFNLNFVVDNKYLILTICFFFLNLPTRCINFLMYIHDLVFPDNR